MAWRAEFWAEHVAAQPASGLSQRAYCAQHGIKPRNFRRWAQRLQRRGEGAAPPTDGAEAPPSGSGASDMVSTRTEDVLLPPPVAEVLAHPERRRRWTPEQKLRLVIETLAPGASLSMIARRHGVHSSVLFRWRRQLATRAPGAQAAVALAGGGLPRLAPVRVAPALPESVPVAAPTPTAVPALRPAASLPTPVAAETSAADSAADAGRMEIELAGGARVRVDRHVDADALRRVLAALAGTGPVAP